MIPIVIKRKVDVFKIAMNARLHSEDAFDTGGYFNEQVVAERLNGRDDTMW